MDLDFVANNWHLFAALVVISLLIGFDTLRRGGGGANQVSAVQLPQLINKENAVVVDVCEPDEFNKGHIPKAINIPVSQIKDQLGQLESFVPKTGRSCCRAAAVSGQAVRRRFFARTNSRPSTP